ncbi:MAG TPA: PfkB family carbohydrate kinase [Pirellulales bacterium]|nr:PfkB family carbohydrate kinase [Pirellulales bacterium]
MLDPAPAPQVPLDASLLGLVDYLKPNEHEAQQLTGIRVSDTATAIAAASALVRTAIVTLGSRGACWATRAGALTATRIGAQPSFSTRDELERFAATLEA